MAEPGAPRDRLYALLGDLPPRDRPISAALIDLRETAAYRAEWLSLDLNGLEPVPALFVRPLHGEGPFPTILYSHAHGGDYETGKAELLSGRPSLQYPPYGAALTAKGYAALCIDHWCFGERRGRAESEVFKEMLWRGQVLWGMMVYDTLRALDYLHMRAEVDTARIGAMGLSMGSTLSWWAAALDPRLRACIDLCCLTDYEALIAARGLDLHGIYYYVPGLLRHFSTAQINALIAPRPHLSLVGEYDPLTPMEGVLRVDAALRHAYAEAGASDAWQLFRSASGHFETAAMRRAILDFLARWLPA